MRKGQRKLRYTFSDVNLKHVWIFVLVQFITLPKKIKDRYCQKQQNLRMKYSTMAPSSKRLLKLIVISQWLSCIKLPNYLHFQIINKFSESQPLDLKVLALTGVLNVMYIIPVHLSYLTLRKEYRRRTSLLQFHTHKDGS